MPSDNCLLTPTYQDILIVTLNTVILRMMNSDFKGAWIGIKTLYRILPPKCKDDTKQLYDETAMELAELPKQANTFLFENTDIRAREAGYLSVKAWDLFETIITSLHNKGYLVFESNRPPTRESSMKDLEFTLAKAKFGKLE